MQDIHDERRIPVEVEPADPGFLAKLRRLIAGDREKRVERDTKAQITEIRNTPLRMANYRRQLRQPGQHPDVVEKALRMLSRVGRGSSV